MEVTRTGAFTVVMILKRLDAGTAPGAEQELRAVLATAPEKLVLDFSQTDYVASAGLRVLLVITRDQMKAGRKVAMAGIRPPVLKVFEMAGFTSIFTIRATRDEAFRAL